MKKLIILCLLCLLCGCRVAAEKQTGSSNRNVTVEILFTDEQGYTVKRFYDAGQPRYYVTPEGMAHYNVPVSEDSSISETTITTKARNDLEQMKREVEELRAKVREISNEL